MATEIERKFLLNDESWRAEIKRSLHMRQGYLANNGTSSVRVRISDDKAWLNIKSATLGISRSEFEYAIPVSDAEQLLDTLVDGPLIEKIRHHVEYGSHLWEIDEFSGDNAGLIVAEIELNSTTETFAMPPWAGQEVSNDTRYYNVCLVSHPYKDW